MDVVTLTLAKKSTKEYVDEVIEGIGRGISYKGAVNYYNNLPNNAKLGDCYSVLYKDTSGFDPSGAEYVWGKVDNNSNPEWIKLGEDISGKFDTSKVKTSTSTTSGDVYDVTYINTMLGNVETLLGGI